jgi:hypothetical protein
VRLCHKATRNFREGGWLEALRIRYAEVIRRAGKEQGSDYS